MKGNFLCWTLGLLLIFVYSSCVKDSCTEINEYYQYTPIFMTKAGLIDSFGLQDPRKLENPGKIYVYNNWLFINEYQQGIHVVDNSDPVNPKNIGFLEIVGNADMAIKDDVLYADSYENLWLIDIKDPLQARVIDADIRLFGGQRAEDKNLILVGYHKTKVILEQPCNQHDIIICGDGFIKRTGGGESKSNNGIGGSMARFTIVDQNLYILFLNNLITYDIKDAKRITLKSKLPINWDNETIFPCDSYLFVGSRSGMSVYSISNPDYPKFISEIKHINACDPVVVSDNIAYVTLRDGTNCNQFSNQLEIIDLYNIDQPERKRIVPMKNPHGLAIAGENMIICEGKHGFKTLRLKSDFDVNLMAEKNDHAAFDVILLGYHHALIIGENGFFQYDISDIQHPKLLSKIAK